jgi:predicted  nucleic acid-binding Zn-ribbon protein
MASTQRISDAQRRQMIAEAAYYRAKARGFLGGDPSADWLAAESDIDRQLNGHGHEHWLKALESQLSSGKEKFERMKKSVTGKRKAAQAELKKDVEKLGDMLESFEERLEELKERGEKATRKARKKAEVIGEEVSELVHRLGSRNK